MGSISKIATWISVVSSLAAFIPHTEAQLALGPTSYTASYNFPVEVYYEYWNDPTNKSTQPQPKVYNPLTGLLYPENYTSATDIPLNDTVDFRPLPAQLTPEEIVAAAITKVQAIFDDPLYTNNTCAKAISTLDVAQMTAIAAPTLTYQLAQYICPLWNVTAFDNNFSEYCNVTYSPEILGNIMTTIFSLIDVHGRAGQAFVNYYWKACTLPPPLTLNISQYLTEKPNPPPAPKPPSGIRRKVLHLSDFHLDMRYLDGAEAMCNDYMCCKLGAYNPASPNNITAPAARLGSPKCDTPLSLAYAAAEAIPVLTNSYYDPFAFVLFTGDIVPHATSHTLSIGTAEEYEFLVLEILKLIAGEAPVYAALGNHDGNPEGFGIPHSVTEGLGYQSDWNYRNFAMLNQYFGWMGVQEAAMAMANYGCYVSTTEFGLKVIHWNSIVTGYVPNFGTYLSYNFDPAGVLEWLINELQIAEDLGESVILISHVPTAWAVGNAHSGPSDLFNQIVERYSPHVIRNIFFGHTHEDQFAVHYANNASVKSAETALAVQNIMPSLTPLTDLNSGFRVYDMDVVTGDIYESHTFFSNVSDFASLDEKETTGPTFEFEYSAREAYGKNITWPTDAPLNATWWHLVTEQFAINNTLVNEFRKYQSKSSIYVEECNSTCQEAVVCYMQSASVPLTGECIQGYSSTQ